MAHKTIVGLYYNKNYYSMYNKGLIKTTSSDSSSDSQCEIELILAKKLKVLVLKEEIKHHGVYPDNIQMRQQPFFYASFLELKIPVYWIKVYKTELPQKKVICQKCGVLITTKKTTWLQGGEGYCTGELEHYHSEMSHSCYMKRDFMSPNYNFIHRKCSRKYL